MPPAIGRVDASRVQASHSQGWDEALDRALKNVKLGRNKKAKFRVEFSAMISNPGEIQQYIVTLTP
jgi:hypothetical protein